MNISESISSNKFSEKDLQMLLKKFNWKYYLDNNKDLVGLIKTKQMAIHHFKKYGYKEGRKCTQQTSVNPLLNERFLLEETLDIELKNKGSTIINIVDKQNTIIYYSKTNLMLFKLVIKYNPFHVNNNNSNSRKRGVVGILPRARG